MDSDRRHYQRVNFEMPAKISDGSRTFECEVIDLSIHGVLLKTDESVDSSNETLYELNIPLSDDSHTIRMSLKLTHQHPKGLGFVCENIDVDSITHLRKVIELNCGDSSILDRDFETLCNENH